MEDERTGEVVVAGQGAPNGPLAIRADLIPTRAAERVTDVLPATAYEHVGQYVVTEDQKLILDQPLDDDEVNVKPDGSVYTSHEYCRRQLNAAFGPLGWTLVPGCPLSQRPGTNEWYQRWTLYIGGVYVSEALGSHEYFEKNRNMDLSDVAESIKSQALTRCCKDVGIAHEMWNRKWAEKWRRAHAIQVVVRSDQGNRNQWRRKDSDPFPKEISSESKPSPAPAPPHAAAENAAAGNSPPASTAAPTPSVGPEKAPPAVGPAVPPVSKAARPAPPASPAAAAQPAPPAPAPTPAAAAPKSGPRIMNASAQQLITRARNCGLIVGDDATPLFQWLVTRELEVIVEGDMTETIIRSVPPSKFALTIAALDQYAKQAKAAPPEEGAVEAI
ncbi:MAG TPA: hypothetical protein VNF29_15550 [Candidatus Binataceae bacterium]|nr:hypothetical protein [Candidatus Binataceae bacterium]